MTCTWQSNLDPSIFNLEQKNFYEPIVDFILSRTFSNRKTKRHDRNWHSFGNYSGCCALLCYVRKKLSKPTIKWGEKS